MLSGNPPCICTTANSTELIHGLHRGRFDLALVYDLELGHSINKERLNAPHKPYALLPAAHPLAQKAQVTLQELSREPMILLDAVPSKKLFYLHL